jgi:hypothetical protein
MGENFHFCDTAKLIRVISIILRQQMWKKANVELTGCLKLAFSPNRFYSP